MKNNLIFRKIIILFFVLVFIFIFCFFVFFLYFKKEDIKASHLEENIPTTIEQKPNNFWNKIQNSPEVDQFKDKVIETSIAKVNQILDKTKEKILNPKEKSGAKTTKKTNIKPNDNQLVLSKDKSNEKQLVLSTNKPNDNQLVLSKYKSNDKHRGKPNVSQSFSFRKRRKY